MKKQLWLEMGKQTLLSIAIFACLFIALYLVELFIPSLHGKLLQWDNLAFIVGIPASVIGTAYVLTIKNPNNYLGFYLGIVMSLLLAWQFYLQGQYDLVILYTLLFVPFLLRSLITWRKATLYPEPDAEPFVPSFLHTKQVFITRIIYWIIILADFGVVTYLSMRNPDAVITFKGIFINLMGAMLIGSSIFANYWLIHKSNDAWIYWVIYSLAGMVLNALIGNAFSFVLFTMFLIINGSAQVAWIKMTDEQHLGWTEPIHRILNRTK